MSVETVLEVRSLSKRYGGVLAVDAVTFSLSKSELVCIIGPNGAGKSSLVKMLSGAMRPTGGDIWVRGRRITGQSADKFCRQGIVLKFQGTNVFSELSVRDNLLVAQLGVAAWRSGNQPAVNEVMTLVDLSGAAHVKAGQLSHGQKQWLELGMALITQPDILLLDEPAAGMSMEETLKVSKLIDAMRRDSAVIVIEHDMAFVRGLRCRTLVMHQGVVIRDGRYEELEEDREIRDIYLGREVRRA